MDAVLISSNESTESSKRKSVKAARCPKSRKYISLTDQLSKNGLTAKFAVGSNWYQVTVDLKYPKHIYYYSLTSLQDQRKLPLYSYLLKIEMDALRNNNRQILKVISVMHY